MIKTVGDLVTIAKTSGAVNATIATIETTAISQAEKELERKFPSEYFEFLHLFGGGGRVSHACVLGIPQQTDFDREVRFIESVVQENDRFWSEMGYPKELLAFAWDEADTFWCFDFSTDPSDGPVVRVCGTAANYAIGRSSQ